MYASYFFVNRQKIRLFFLILPILVPHKIESMIQRFPNTIVVSLTKNTIGIEGILVFLRWCDGIGTSLPRFGKISTHG